MPLASACLCPPFVPFVQEAKLLKFQSSKKPFAKPVDLRVPSVPVAAGPLSSPYANAESYHFCGFCGYAPIYRRPKPVVWIERIST
jgi:hypothetical protein